MNESTIFDLPRLHAKSFVQRVEFHRELPSTNTLALELATDNAVETPLLVLTELQTAGRGRGANRWWADEGALTFSLVIESTKEKIEVEQWPQISLTVGLAICEALRELLPDLDIGLKWPNDVFIDRRKVCGILVEVPSNCAGRIVIGVGINVNNSFAEAPAELQEIATSLFDAARLNHDMTDFLIEVLKRISSRLEFLGRDALPLQKMWQEFCILQGRTVHLETGSKRVVGVCHGIDQQGALILQTETGHDRFFGGVVAHIE